MPLVDYSDSDADDADAALHETARRPAKKRKCSIAGSGDLPPLPPSFHDLYSVNTRVATSDDPTLHGGRKRQIPHVQGNWPSHVYLEWHPTPAETVLLNNLVSPVGHAAPSSPPQQQKHTQTQSSSSSSSSSDASAPTPIHSLLLSELSTPLPLHISLSRSLVLPSHQRDSFLELVTQNIRSSGVRPFSVDFVSVAWYPNHDRTRWFLSLSVAAPVQNELNRLLGACNRAARAMGQPMLYEAENLGSMTDGGSTRNNNKKQKTTQRDGISEYSEIPNCSDSFHVSLAWSLSQPATEATVAKRAPEELKDMSTVFDVVKVKIGNTVTAIPLSNKAAESRRGILG